MASAVTIHRAIHKWRFSQDFGIGKQIQILATFSIFRRFEFSARPDLRRDAPCMDGLYPKDTQPNPNRQQKLRKGTYVHIAAWIT